MNEQNSERDPLGVTISTREIYDVLVGLRDDVRELTSSSARTEQTLDDHEDRLRAIEKWRYSAPVAAVAAALSLAAALAKTLGLV